MESDAVSLLPSLTRNLAFFRARLGAPDNADVIVRRFRAGAMDAALLAIDGMADTKTINENILKPCMELPETAGDHVPEDSRISFLMESAVSVLPMKLKDNFDEIIADALSGQSVLLCEGCAQACVMDTRGFEKRTIGRPEAEKVVLGAHESFSESIRTSITLIRRIVQREELTTEFISVGGAMKTRCALLYLRGTADEAMIARIRRRLMACQSDFPLSCGDIEQAVESHPLALIPQCVRTERPDRAASFLAEGQIVILTDGSPEALGAPATLFHQLHTPDDSSMRWQYGTFLRVVRLIGVLVHLFLPGLYLSILRFHPELLSAMLLTSVYETSSRVPFPVFHEALLMTIAFYLITEAGLRAPGALGSALGIVSGLILGQSAVSADIVSPLLLIVVAASGLGGFCVPGYALSVGLKITQLMMMSAGALGGLYAMGLLSLALLCLLCAMTSLGSPLAAPVAPKRIRNPDLLLRLPLARQRAQAFYAQRRMQDARASRVHAAFRTRACAAGLCVGAQVFILGAGAATALSLNAAWIAALSALPAAGVAAALCRRRLCQSLCGGGPGRIPRLLLCLSLMLSGVCVLSALVSLAGQTLLPLAQMTFILALTLLLLSLCALGASTGAARAAYALRFLPLGLLAALILSSADSPAGSGLFPFFGAGFAPLGLSCALMLSCAAPALLLLLPPAEAGELSGEDVPSTGFFVRRAVFGAAGGCLLLFVLIRSSTLETLAGYSSFGERLRLIPAGGGHGGFLFFFLTLCQLSLLLLSGVNLLLGGEEALVLSFPALKGHRAALMLLVALCALSLLMMTAYGFDAALAAGALSGIPALLALMMGGKQR